MAVCARRADRALSDEFNGETLDSRWSWVRQPATGTFGLENGTFRFNTQAADLFEDGNTASVLSEPAPNRQLHRRDQGEVELAGGGLLPQLSSRPAW